MAKNLPQASEIIRPYRVEKPDKFQLSSFDPGDTQGLHIKEQAADLLRERVAKISELQQKLYADGCWGILLIFQSMDAGGKDSVIRHVLTGVNPEGCQVYSFKTPSAEELRHDFLWRTSKNAPQRGHIALFSRSYYEEVLIVRVHPEILAKQRLPERLITENIWQERLEDISAFERYLDLTGFLVRIFFLHVSKDEQKRRFLRRLTQTAKHWKFAEDDLRDREQWDAYVDAYEDAIGQTATPHAPWYIVPADHKWFTRLVVASAVIEALESLNLEYPELDKVTRKKMEEARKQLLSGG